MCIRKSVFTFKKVKRCFSSDENKGIYIVIKILKKKLNFERDQFLILDILHLNTNNFRIS